MTELRRFGGRLREARIASGLSQTALAALSGVHRIEIGRIEAGKRDPQITTLLRLARALGVPPGRLVV